MDISNTGLDGVQLVEPVVHGDARGFFVEVVRVEQLRKAGVDVEFVQDNHSRSQRGTVRGMHFQPGQAKLVRCARGAIFDVIVDIRVGSPTFGRWEGFELDDEAHRQLYIPDGFAHGFCVVSEVADVIYKVSSYYDPATEAGFRFDDPDVAIEWPRPSPELIVSQRDATAPTLAEITPGLPFAYRV